MEAIATILEVFGEIILRFSIYTSRLLVPLLSGGKLDVERDETKAPPVKSLRWHGCYRNAGNRWVLSSFSAGILGLLFWVLVVVILARALALW